MATAITVVHLLYSIHIKTVIVQIVIPIAIVARLSRKINCYLMHQTSTIMRITLVIKKNKRTMVMIVKKMKMMMMMMMMLLAT